MTESNNFNEYIEGLPIFFISKEACEFAKQKYDKQNKCDFVVIPILDVEAFVRLDSFNKSSPHTIGFMHDSITNDKFFHFIQMIESWKLTNLPDYQFFTKNYHGDCNFDMRTAEYVANIYGDLYVLCNTKALIIAVNTDSSCGISCSYNTDDITSGYNNGTSYCNSKKSENHMIKYNSYLAGTNSISECTCKNYRIAVIRNKTRHWLESLGVITK